MGKLQAVRRYLPFVTFIPILFFLFIMTVGGAFGAVEAELFIFIINTFLIGYFGLWFFIRSLKLPFMQEENIHENQK